MFVEVVDHFFDCLLTTVLVVEALLTVAHLELFLAKGSLNHTIGKFVTQNYNLMIHNYDFLEIGDKQRFDYERVLLSAECIRFQPKGEHELVQVVITKRKFFIVKNDVIDRYIALVDIEAVTNSFNSDEFIIHVEESVDERFSCVKNKHEILQMILYLQTTSGSTLVKSQSSVDPSFKMKVYMVPDLSLDIYLTTAEDIESGHVIRPDEKHRKMLNYKEFLQLDSIYAERKEHRSRSTRTIYTKEGSPKVTVDDFELIKTLGKGAHGKVLLCERRNAKHERFAMKIIKKQHIIDANQIEHTIAEKIILSRLTHPFLISLKYAFQNETKIYFVMEFMKGGELFQHLRKVKRFNEEQTKFIAACVITALGHLHNKDFIYRDLKPENVLLDERGFAKLTDFGLAKSLPVTDIAKTFCGTPEYLAPEVILEKGCNRPADWWSLGVLVYEMLFGLPPFYSKDIQEMYRKTLLDKVKFSSKIIISPEAKDFLLGLLVKAPSKRLGSIADSLEVMNHPWFKDFNWARLLDKNMTPPYNPSADDWEKNFDPGFVKEQPKDSVCSIDSAKMTRYKHQFRIFDEESSDGQLVNNQSSLTLLPSSQTTDKQDTIEVEGNSMASRFMESLKREAELNKSSESQCQTPPPTSKAQKDCTKRLNFGEDGHPTPDTLSDNQPHSATKNDSPITNDFPSKNSFDISDKELRDIESAFNTVME